jgi:hypothetical protein
MAVPAMDWSRSERIEASAVLVMSIMPLVSPRITRMDE